MPGISSVEKDPTAMRALWAQIYQELIAKGLTEGTGKFREVASRHFAKRQGRLPNRVYGRTSTRRRSFH
jgi:hypothetical protein